MIHDHLRKKVGRLFVCGLTDKEVTPEIKELIHTYHIGGIILFSRNMGTPEEVFHLNQCLQAEAKRAGYTRPLLIGVDQENGIVRRISEGVTLFPGAMALGATDDTQAVYDIHYATGEELKALGFNWNIAPAVDVNVNPNNPVIGVRSFGESPEKVAAFGLQAMKGLQDAGLITTLKHFPGHGDTDVDSHLDLPVISHTIERLEQVELKPFQTCIDAGSDVVMTSHLYLPKIEAKANTPATISKSVLTDLLRNKLNFTGVITTDCMEMDAIINKIGIEEGAVETIKAGGDIVMVSHTPKRQKRAIEAILEAVEAGEMTEERLDESNMRINQLIDQYVSWDTCLHTTWDKEKTRINTNEHHTLAQETYRKSVTVVKTGDVLPVTNPSAHVLVIEPQGQSLTQAEDARDQAPLSDAIKLYTSKVDVITISASLTEADIGAILEQAIQVDYVILGTLNVGQDHMVAKLAEKLTHISAPLIAVAMRSPYDFNSLKEADAFINTYEPTHMALQLAAATIFGKETVHGKLPVTLNHTSHGLVK